MQFPRIVCTTILFYAQKGKCILCGYRLPPLADVREANDPVRLSLDHVIPKVYAGKNTIWNFGLTHNKCNSDRGHAPLTRDQEVRIAYAQRDILEILASMGITVAHPQEVLRHKSIEEAKAMVVDDLPEDDAGILSDERSDVGRSREDAGVVAEVREERVSNVVGLR